MKPSEIDNAYAAGFMDGEGSVMLMPGPKIAPYRARLKVTLCQVEMPCLEWLLKTFGGKIRQRESSREGTRRPAFEWYLCGKHAAEFLVLVRPYLRLKGAQADLAFEYTATVQRKGGRRIPVSDETIAIREQMRSKMKWLNRRGVAALSKTEVVSH